LKADPKLAPEEKHPAHSCPFPLIRAEAASILDVESPALKLPEDPAFVEVNLEPDVLPDESDDVPVLNALVDPPLATELPPEDCPVLEENEPPALPEVID